MLRDQRNGLLHDRADRNVRGGEDAAIKLRRQGDDAAARNDDPAVDRAVDALVANQRARWSLEEARFRDVRKVLTPRQAARLLVVLPAIDRRLQGQLQRAIGGDRGRRRQPGPPD